MSRPARTLSETGMYHVIFRGLSRQNLFEEENDFEKMIETINRVKNEFQFDIVRRKAWVCRKTVYGTA